MALRYTMIRRATVWLLDASVALGALSSCANDADEATSSTVAASGGDVRISFSSVGGMAGSAGTRADSNATTTEAGDDNLNENTINRLDLYVFNGTADDAACDKHVYCIYDKTTSTTTGYGTLTYSSTPDSDKKCTGTWEGTGLYWADIKPAETATTDETTKETTTVTNYKTIYIVANDSLGDSRNIGSLGDLKGCTASHSLFVPTDKQATFLMDGKVENLELNVNVVKETTDGTTTYTICNSTTATENSDGTIRYTEGGGVELSRALAKIRLKVLAADNTDITTAMLTADTKDMSVIYHLVNYANEASVTADGTDITTTTALQSELDDLKGSELPQQNGKAVFYTYPNNWYDESKNMKVEEPINSERQTYVLLRAPYPTSAAAATDKTKIYWYKVPVNYRLQENNDDASAVVDEALYKTQRNYIYDVTVTIDRKGGTYSDPVTLNVQYLTQEWDDKENEVTFQ